MKPLESWQPIPFPQAYHARPAALATDVFHSLTASTDVVGWLTAAPWIAAVMPPADHKSLTVLLVDDEPDILGSYQRILQMDLTDVRILTANSGGEALQVLDRTHCDLVISDYRMPKMDGVNLLREVREQQPDVARMLLTAYPDPEVERRAHDEADVDYFMSKAGDLQKFLNAVRDTLGMPPQS